MRGNSFADCGGFHKTDESDDGSAGEQAHEQLPRGVGSGQWREAARDVTDDGAVPARAIAGQPTGEDGDDDNNKDAGPLWLDALDEQQAKQGGDAEEESREVAVVQVGEGGGDVVEIEAGTRLCHAEELAELSERDDNGACVGETGDGGMRDEIDDDRQFEYTDGEQDHAGKTGKNDSEGGEFRGRTGSDIKVGEDCVREQ